MLFDLNTKDLDYVETFLRRKRFPWQPATRNKKDAEDKEIVYQTAELIKTNRFQY